MKVIIKINVDSKTEKPRYITLEDVVLPHIRRSVKAVAFTPVKEEATSFPSLEAAQTFYSNHFSTPNLDVLEWGKRILPNTGRPALEFIYI